MQKQTVIRWTTPNRETGKQYRKPSDVHHCDIDSDDKEDEHFVINTIHTDEKAKDKIFENLQLNNEVFFILFYFFFINAYY